MKLIVGLGNPGPQYRDTRHNIGWQVLAELARRYGAPAPTRKFDGEIIEFFVESEKCVLLAPLTYMNNSGRSVGAAVDFYRQPTHDLLVVCDDMNLDSGRLRLRGDDSAGGQNGLKDILTRLATTSVPRLRVGIGRPPGRMSATDYVLGTIKPPERETLDIAIIKAADGILHWATQGLTAAMNVVNAAEVGPKSK